MVCANNEHLPSTNIDKLTSYLQSQLVIINRIQDYNDFILAEYVHDIFMTIINHT
jgi:hypothetical protein